MIKLTRLDGSKFTLNAELILLIEETPDTVISLTDGHKFIIKESESEVIEKIIAYKQKLFYMYRELA
ncbi:MAG: flagellar FlbD family protein [Halanaerobiales bacterium]|nr:flagellar FlbD family protein [Halanaerobiales bacterium]